MAYFNISDSRSLAVFAQQGVSVNEIYHSSKRQPEAASKFEPLRIVKEIIIYRNITCKYSTQRNSNDRHPFYNPKTISSNIPIVGGLVKRVAADLGEVATALWLGSVQTLL